MNIECLYKYIAELSRCEWLADTTIGGIKYNGIDNAFGVDYYSKVLANMQSDAELVLLDFALNDKTQVLITLYNKVKEICEFSYDVITIDDVEALKRDSVGSQNKKDIELGCFVVEMFGVQRYFQQLLLGFIGSLLNVSASQEIDINQNQPTGVVVTAFPTVQEDERIIKGVKGLAERLGIGVTKAQEILNSGVLQKYKGTAYRNGKAWRINAEKLDEIIAENPNVFRRVLGKS